MAGISINLLPAQFKIDQKAQRKFQLVQTISIIVLLLLIFISSVSIAIRILQSKDLEVLKQEVKVSQDRVSSLKDKEASVFVLKNRLNMIGEITKAPSKNNSLIYNTILSLIPPNVSISSISLDRSGTVVTSTITPDLKTLELMIESMTSKSSFEIISKIDFESLSRGRDGTYRANLKIATN